MRRGFRHVGHVFSWILTELANSRGFEVLDHVLGPLVQYLVYHMTSLGVLMKYFVLINVE